MMTIEKNKVRAWDWTDDPRPEGTGKTFWWYETPNKATVGPFHNKKEMTKHAAKNGYEAVEIGWE